MFYGTVYNLEEFAGSLPEAGGSGIPNRNRMMPTNCPWCRTVNPVVLLTSAEFCVNKITTQNNWHATLNGVIQNFK